MRVLLARRVSTGAWFLRAESSDKPVGQFATELASNFGLPAADIETVVADEVTPAAFSAVLRELERGLVRGPGAAVWPLNDPDASFVYDAPTVDAVTAARIRRAVGGADPIQEQLKQLRLALVHTYAVDHAQWPDGTPVNDQEKADARAFLMAARQGHQTIERLRAEGRAMKGCKGWA